MSGLINANTCTKHTEEEEKNGIAKPNIANQMKMKSYKKKKIKQNKDLNI